MLMPSSTIYVRIFRSQLTRAHSRQTAWLPAALVAIGLLGSHFSARAEQPEDWPFQDAQQVGPIEYVRNDAPPVTVAVPKFEKYEDSVPDTFDVAERAKLAINALTTATDDQQDHEMYFSCYLGNPLRMAHNFSDWCTPKYVEALALLRFATGGDEHTSVDDVWANVLVKSIGPDGLYYFPLNGKPWYGKELWWANGVARRDGTIFATERPRSAELLKDLDTYATSRASSMVQEAGITQFAHPQPCGRILNVLNIYYMRDRNPAWKQISEGMVDRLLELAIQRDDYCYFPAYYFEPHAKYDPADPRAAEPKGLQGGEINGRCIQGPAVFYQLTGYEPARELASKLTNYMRYHDDYFGPNGEFTGDQHFHAHAVYLLEMLHLAVATNDQELLDFVRKSFEWAKSPVGGMSTVSGFTPEFSKPYKTSEGCAVADIIALALKLSHASAGDYYEDAERWTRNHFAEMQLTPEMADTLIQLGSTMPAKQPLPNETVDRVAERSIGSFASWATGNEWIGSDERGTDNLIMHCCTGNCTRTLYYIWRHTLDHDENMLRVNLLLNRASPWADVYSCIPYEGRVQVKVKQDCPKLLVHAPEWIATESKEITVEVDGVPRNFDWQKRYLDLGKVPAGATVKIKFPNADRVVANEAMGLARFTLKVRGNTIVSIDPPGVRAPLYQRDHVRSGNAPWRMIDRVVYAETIDY